ncbi:MAG: hypothetical protein Q7V88_05520 [Actinomycetota bacterium]|nr:hypothetical protein [Actinomycetota bacterium]
MNPAARLGTLVALGLLSLSACGDDDPDQRSESNYCTQVGNHLAEINSPAIATSADIERTIAAWKAVAASAPLAVEAEWYTMVANLETASTVDPDDPASMQLVADSARASEPAANLVITYTRQKCGANIGAPAPPTTAVSETALTSTVVTSTAVTTTAVTTGSSVGG